MADIGGPEHASQTTASLASITSNDTDPVDLPSLANPLLAKIQPSDSDQRLQTRRCKDNQPKTEPQAGQYDDANLEGVTADGDTSDTHCPDLSNNVESCNSLVSKGRARGREKRVLKIVGQARGQARGRRRGLGRGRARGRGRGGERNTSQPNALISQGQQCGHTGLKPDKEKQLQGSFSQTQTHSYNYPTSQSGFVPKRTIWAPTEKSQPNTVLKVSGLTPTIDKKLLSNYLSHSKSDESNKEIKCCYFVPTTDAALVTFTSSEASERILSKENIQVEGADLKFCRAQCTPIIGYDATRLFLRNIPANNDRLSLKMFLQAISIPRFSIGKVVDGTAIIQLQEQYELSYEDIESTVEKINSRPVRDGLFLKAEMIPLPNTLRIKNISEDREPSFLEWYFSSTIESGGGNLCLKPSYHPDGKEAVVVFHHPEVLKAVIQNDHTEAFGENAILEVVDPFTQASLKVPISPLVASALNKHPEDLQSKLRALNVRGDVHSDHVLLTATESACSGWEDSCTQLVSEHFVQDQIIIQREISKEVMQKLKSYDSQQIAFDYRTSNDGSTLIVAGNVLAIQSMKTYQEELLSKTSETVRLSSQTFDYLIQLRVESIKRDNPGVTICPSGYSFLLEGPTVLVRQIKTEMYRVQDNINCFPVLLQAKLLQHFSSESGRQQIKSFLDDTECPVAYSFTFSSPEQSNRLSFVCTSETALVGTLAKKFSEESDCQSLAVSKVFAAKFDEMKDFKTSVTKLQAEYKTCISFIKIDCSFFIYGFTRQVSDCLKQLNYLVEQEKLVDQISRSHPLSPEEMTYFEHIQAKDLANKFRQIDIVCKRDEGLVVVSGLNKKVEHFLQNIHVHLRHECIPFSDDTLLVDFFLSSAGKKHLDEFLTRGSYPPVATYIDNNPLTKCIKFVCKPVNKTSTEEMAEKLLDQACTRKVLLTETFTTKGIKLSVHFKDLRKKLKSKYQVKYAITKKEIVFAGLQDNVTKAVQEMNEFVTKECSTTKDMQLEHLEWRILEISETWKTSIQCQFSSIQTADSTVTLQFTGDPVDIMSDLENMQKFRQKIQKKFIPVRTPGSYKFFLKESTKDILRGIEANHNVFIECVPTQQDEMTEAIDMPSKLSEYCSAILITEISAESKTIKVFIGDITEIVVDVIVNAANGRLKHHGGLARAIVQKGGEEIQDDCTGYLRGTEMSEGEVYLSTVTGKLPCQAVVHAVGPCWSEQTKSHAKHRLSQACVNSLIEARRYTSIAFPAISSGIFKYPLKECALVHTETVIKFLKTTKTSLREIFFVVIDLEHAKVFEDALNQCLPDTSFSSKVTTSIASSSNSLSSEPKNKHSISLKPIAKPRRVPSLHQGDIFSVSADVYVYTANRDLNLSSGVIAKRVSEKAGPSLQKECSLKGKANIGDVVVTGPGQLGCRHVFHAVACNYSSDTSGKVLRGLLRKCFSECEKRQVNSIVLPAIGSGGLGYPAKRVAKIMIEEASIALSETKDPSLKIHLVIFKNDDYVLFKKEVSHFTEANPTTYFRRPQLFLSASQPSILKAGASPLAPQFVVDGIKIDIVNGDITKESADAIVNTTSPSINLGSSGQVSAALLKKAGKEQQDLCNAAVKSCGQLAEGVVISTDAIQPLQCKSIFHVYFNSNDYYMYVQTVKACLQEAQNKKYRSIAFPAIGTGAQNYPIHKAACGMIDGIGTFALSGHQTVQEVRIVIFDPSIFESFLKEVTDLQRYPINELDNDNPVYDYDADSEYSGSNNTDSSNSDIEWYAALDNIAIDTKQTEGTAVALQGSTALSGGITNIETFDPDKEASPRNESVLLATRPKGVQFKVYGLDAKDVTYASEKLKALSDERCVSAPFDDHCIRSFNSKQRDQIRAECKQLEVECIIDFDSIHLRGDIQDISIMKDTVNKFIRLVASNVDKKELEIDSLYQQVRWKHIVVLSDGKEEFADYEKEISYEIEQKFKKYRKRKSKHRIFKYHKDPLHLTIDFHHHCEIDHTKLHGAHKRVKRFDLTSNMPSYWDEMPQGKSLHCYDLNPSDGEYKTVLEAFTKTMAKGKNYTHIVNIQRVQNSYLNCQYQEKKKAMVKANPPVEVNERQLFHGTDCDSAKMINAIGFSRSYIGKHGALYGVGNYFALHATYSAHPKYSKPDTSGHKYIYLARVLVGESTNGHSSMKAPPPKDPSKDPTILFDSLVNDIRNPTIFVVGPDAQSYPEYLIIFK